MPEPNPGRAAAPVAYVEKEEIAALLAGFPDMCTGVAYEW